MAYNLRDPAVKRLQAECRELCNPHELYHASPLEESLFQWHFTIRGPDDTDFSGGVYHGNIIIPSNYPMSPPSFYFTTPSGRFELNKKICLSISDYHPDEWQPCWTIGTALLGIISLFPAKHDGSIGSVNASPEERRRLAAKSVDFVCPNCGQVRDLLVNKPTETIHDVCNDQPHVVEAISSDPEEDGDLTVFVVAVVVAIALVIVAFMFKKLIGFGLSHWPGCGGLVIRLSIEGKFTVDFARDCPKWVCCFGLEVNG